jgi:hypothetical protein
VANDAALFFHGSLAAGTTMTQTTAQNGVAVDLGSNTLNRTLLVERRITALNGQGLDTTFQDSADGTTFSAMPGATGGLLGFKRGTTTIYGSTDTLAPGAPERIVIRTDKRYVRMVSTPIGTTFASVSFSVVAKVLDGSFAMAVGAIDS